MKVFEIKVIRVDANDGRYAGTDRLALTLNAEKAMAVAEAKAEEITAKPYWRMTYGVKNGRPDILVEDLGEVTL